ncbi:MAG: plastocyanin/azurin family copper-binding protein [Gemmatimonadota bacterium]
MMRFILPAALGLITVAGAACSTSDSSGLSCQGAGANASVSATGSLAFTPNAVTITAGQSVCWQNTGSVSHTVTADGGSFASPLDPSQTFTRTFATAGTFPYHCTIHAGMVGTVTVN